MSSMFMPKKSAKTGKTIRGPTVPKTSLDDTKQKARQLDHRAIQIAEEYEKEGHPIYSILHSNAVLTKADKGVLADAITTIDDALHAYNALPSCFKSTGNGAIAQLKKTREALYIVLRGRNWARLPQTILLILFEMMANENMVYDLFGKRPQYTLALVCKAWHETVLECSAMWGKISIRNFEQGIGSTKLFRFSAESFKALEEVIKRSKRHQLCLSVNVTGLAMDRTLDKKTTQAYWADKHVYLLVQQASRWASVTMSCRPSLMACLSMLRAPSLRNLTQLSLELKPIPGEVYTQVYAVQELSQALNPKRCTVVLKGFEILSRKKNLIIDAKRRFLTVHDGALLDPFNFSSLSAVAITGNLSLSTAGLVTDSTIDSVSELLARSSCTTKITVLTLTNAVFSPRLLDLLHSLVNLSELQVRAVGRGSEELKLVKLRTMLKLGKAFEKHDKTVERRATLVNLVRLVFVVDVDPEKHGPGYEIFFSTAFSIMLKGRSAGKLRTLQLSPSTRKLVADKHWQEISGLKKISIRVQEPGMSF